jgi:hypothetical protein
MDRTALNTPTTQILPWNAPTSPDITTASSALAAAVPHLLPFLSAPNVTFTPFAQNSVDVAFWTLSGQTLLMAANPNQSNASLVLQGVTGGMATEVLNGGASLVAQSGGGGGLVLTLEPMGTSAWVFQQEGALTVSGP